MNAFRPAWYSDLGLIDFPRAHALQLKLLEARISGTIDRDVVLVLEHPPVFTVGKRGNRDHLKVTASHLAEAGMDLFHIERGGDITFHGPGQLVLYPIFQLRKAGLGVVDLVEKLEEIMLRTADDVGVSADRDRRNRGIWAGDRKLGFIGIAVRRSVSYHGLALNVNLQLAPFSWIIPCGLQNVHVTSLDLEADRPVRTETVKSVLLHHLEKVFSISLNSVPMNRLKELIQSTQN